MTRLGMVAALVAIALPAAAAETLKADIRCLSLQPRSDAPALCDVTFTRQGAGVLTGRLEITLRRGVERLFTYTTHELGLGYGTKTIRILTPPIRPNSYGAGIDATLRFLTERDAIPLGESPFAGRSIVSRQCTIGVCGERSARGSGDALTWLALRPELLLRNGSPANQIATTPAFFEPRDFPTDPLRLCAFDLVLLHEGAWEKLPARSVAALQHWVAAGGSLAIIGAPDAGTIAFGESHAHLLEDDAAPRPGAIRSYVGLGRCVVLPGADARFPKVVAAWKQASGFLWGANAARFDREEAPRLRTATDWQEFAALQSMIGGSVRLVPPQFIVGILAVCVLLVGPADWWLLGKLRARKFTWILFPLVIAGVTATTLSLAERSLGSATLRVSLVVKDLDAEGRVARQNRVDLTLPARAQVLTLERAATIASPLPMQSRHDLEDVAVPGYSGQFPSRYTTTQPVEQWSPSLVRQMTFDAGADDSGLRWDAFDPRDPARIAGVPPTEWRVMCIGPGRRWSDLAGHDLPSFLFAQRRDFTGERGDLPRAWAPSGAVDFSDLAMSDASDPRQWLVIACRRRGTELQVYRHLFFK